MRLSARNNLKGKVVQIIPGSINSEVHLQLAGGETIVSIITKESVASLGLEVGKEAYAVIKASSIMMGVEH